MKTNATCCPRIIISGGSQWKRHPNCTRMFFITHSCDLHAQRRSCIFQIWVENLLLNSKSNPELGWKNGWNAFVHVSVSNRTHGKHSEKVPFLELAKALKHYLLEVWITTGFTIQFDYDYHVNDSIQFDITMHHNASRLHQIYLVHFFAGSVWNPSWKTSVWPRPLYCNSVPGCYRTSYSLGHLCGEQQL